MIWIDRLYLYGGINNDEYNEFKDLYVPLINKNINIIIASYTDSLTSLKRDYRANLSLEKRNFLNEKNIFEYNRSLLNMRALAIEKNISFNLFDTTDKTEREIAIEVADAILNDMRKFYLKQVDEEFS